MFFMRKNETYFKKNETLFWNFYIIRHQNILVMRKKLSEQLDAMIEFQGFCNKPDNIPVWEHLTAFADGLSKLDLKIKEIILTSSKQEANNKGITKAKKESKIDMANKASAIAAGLQSYSVTEDNLKMFFLMDISFSRIMKAKDGSATGACKLIYDTANGLPMEDIEPFGISEVVLNSLDESIENYNAISPSTGIVIVNKTNLTIKCARLVKEANTIMRKQLLKMGKQFRKSHPDFYRGIIFSARVQHHAVHSKIRITAVNGEDETAIENVLVEIAGTDLKGFTDAKGKITLSRVPEGEREVTLTKENSFRKVVLKDVKFQRGKSITRRVDMDRQYNVPAVKETAKQKASVK
jgi:hypothetical protein